jgi:hypothetical protein
VSAPRLWRMPRTVCYSLPGQSLYKKSQFQKRAGSLTEQCGCLRRIATGRQSCGEPGSSARESSGESGRGQQVTGGSGRHAEGTERRSGSIESHGESGGLPGLLPDSVGVPGLLPDSVGCRRGPQRGGRRGARGGAARTLPACTGAHNRVCMIR